MNCRGQLWDTNEVRPVFEEILKLSSIFKLGYDEAEIVWWKKRSAEKYARYFQGLNRGLVVITLDSKGSVAFEGMAVVSQSGFPVEVIDPVGASDTFVAGFLGGHTLKM
mgnify:CR=1 FL=1